MTETPAQFTERMREKYKEALERLETNGPNELQKAFDRCLSRKLDLLAGNTNNLEKLSDILKRY